MFIPKTIRDLSAFLARGSTGMILKDRELLIKFLCKFMTETRQAGYTSKVLKEGWSGRYPFEPVKLLNRIAAWRMVTEGPAVLAKIPQLIEIATVNGTVLDEEINNVMCGLIEPLAPRVGKPLQDMALNRSNACIVNSTKVQAKEIAKLTIKLDVLQQAQGKRADKVCKVYGALINFYYLGDRRAA